MKSLWFLIPMLFGMNLLAAQQADTTRNPLGANPGAIDEGRRVYDQTCASCHAPAGRGDRGPALDAGSFANGNEDGDLFHTIREGIAGSQMPPFRGLTDQQVWQVVSYIRSLSRAGAPAAAGDAASTLTGNSASGEALFFGRAGCAGCHQVNGRGGIIGPDLSTAGLTPAAALRQKILTPDTPMASNSTGGRGSRGRGAAPPQVIVAATKDGREIRGVRRNEDTFSVQMVDATGQLHLLDKAKLASVRVESRSLMPGDYGTKLTSSELNDLVAFLSARRARDPKPNAATLVPGGVTVERLVRADAEPHNWLMYWGNYQGTHYSGLKEIDATNVRQLQTAWAFPMPGDSVLEAMPLVVDGVMYTTQPGVVVALDARTGRQIWRFARPQKVRNPYEINPFNRGVAILGHRLFVGTLDAALVALDARTGVPIWETAVAG